MRQSEDHRFTGWFYLPETPDHRIPGVLTWVPMDGAHLELFGGFSPGPIYQRNPNGSGLVSKSIVGEVRSGTIFGETTEGKKISIWDAQRGNVSAKLGGIVQQENWSSMWLAVGDHIDSPDDTIFTEVSLDLDDLYYLTQDGRTGQIDWAIFEGVDNPGKKLENGTLLTPYILPIIGGYKADVERGQTSNAQFSVNTFVSRPMMNPAAEAMPELKFESLFRRKRRGLTLDVSFIAWMTMGLKTDVRSSAVDLVDLTGVGLDLMRLAFYQPAGLAEVTLKRENAENVHLLSRIGDQAYPDDPHDFTSVVFTFEDVSLDVYLEVRERLTSLYQAEYAWNVMVGLCGYSPKFVEEYVGQALAAAEGIERWSFQGEDDTHLRKRLENLHKRLPTRIQEVLKLDIETWTSAAVWARNHVAHGGTKKKKLISDSSELYAVARSVHLVTYLSILEELSVPVEKVADALLNHPRLAAMSRSYEIVNKINRDRAV